MHRLRTPLLLVAWLVAAAPAPAAQARMGCALVVPGDLVGRPTGAVGDSSGGPAVGPAVDVEEILSRYNEGIHRTLAGIESLRVVQTIFEPQDDGSTKRACAILSYEGERGMVREETFSELAYPVGEYTLSSLVGPVLEPSGYSVEYAGVEEEEGVSCHRLEVTATSRDHKHFDGSVWISTENLAPVRIVGEVADPPFPAKEVRLDKLFAEGPNGLRLVRRHAGRGEFRILFVTKRGERTIYYDDYEIVFTGASGDAAER